MICLDYCGFIVIVAAFCCLSATKVSGLHSCQGVIRCLCNWHSHILLCFQGSDIETLGTEAAVECGAELLEHLPVGEIKLQDAQASTSTGKNPLFLGLTVKINYYLAPSDLVWS